MDTYIHNNFKFPSGMNSWVVRLDDVDAATPDNASIKPYGAWFTDAEAAAVESLIVHTKYSARSSNGDTFSHLANLQGFTRLRSLSIPTDAIGHIDIKSVASRLEYLRLNRPRTVQGVEQGMGKQLPFLEGVFPSLRSLELYFAPVCYPNFDSNQFPDLQWLGVHLDLDKTARSLRLFRDLHTISGYGLYGVHKKDILSTLPPSLNALELWDVRTKALDLSYLERLSKLKYLTINAGVTLDGRLLSKLPQLVELQLWNLTRIENVGLLMDSHSLQRVSIKYLKEARIPDDIRRGMASAFSTVEFE